MANVITSTNLDIGEIIVGSNGTNEVASQPASALSIPTQTAPLVVDQVVVGASANTVKPLPAQTQGAVFYADPSGKITSDPSVLQIGAGNNLRLGGRIRQYNGQDITSGQVLIGSTGSHSFQTSTLIGVPGQITITNADGAVYIGLVNPSGGYPNIVYASQFGVRAGGDPTANVAGMHAAIQTLSPTSGGKLVIDIPGIIPFNGDIVIDRPLELIGTGPAAFTFQTGDFPLTGTVLRNTRTSGDILRTTTDYPLWVSNCTFEGSGATPVSGSAIHITTNNANPAFVNRNSRVTNCMFSAIWVGVNVDRADRVLITDSIFSQSEFAGIHIHSSLNDSDTVTIMNNHISTNNPTTPTHGQIFYQSGGQIHIVNNGFTNGPYSILYDPLDGGSGNNATEHLIAFNRIENADQALIQFQRTTLVPPFIVVGGLRILGNEMSVVAGSPGLSCIKIQAPLAGPSGYVSSLMVLDNQTGPGVGGVFFNALDTVAGDLVISNNSANNPHNIGIQVTGAQEGVAVGNSFRGPSITPYAVPSASTFRIVDPIGATLTQLTTLMPGTGNGSQVYCTNCKGLQDAGYVAGVCDNTGPATGTTATMRNSVWRC